MTIAEMAPGHSYPAGISMLELATHPVFGEAGNIGMLWRLPVWLPPGFRETTPENVAAAMELLRETDPEARAIIDDLKLRARDPRSRAAAANYLNRRPASGIESTEPREGGSAGS